MNSVDQYDVNTSVASPNAIAPLLTSSINPTIDLQPLIVAGDPNGTPADSSDNRIDPNTTTSPFVGVGSVGVSVEGVGDFLGSGTPISRRHILTAAHVLDVVNDDGIADPLPADVSFNLNFGGILTDRITASSLYIFPEFQGFNTTLENDLAIIELSQDLPAEVPIYSLYQGSITGATLTMIGYGTSGNGIDGFEVGTASFDQKRVGQNQVDLELQGIFLFDFDGADASTNLFSLFGSGTTLGNDVEATLGPGDSGGPSFIQQGNSFLLAGVNTFAFGVPDGFGLPGTVQGAFGTGAGGVILSDPAKSAWINSIIAPPLPSISINDRTVIEGNSGATELTFTLSLSSANDAIVAVDYATADGTAAAADYTAAMGTVQFNPGETTASLTLQIAGDTIVEPDETLLLNLSNATNSTIADNQASGTIANDDLLTPTSPLLLGTPNNDTLVGTEGADVIWGEDGSDRLIGGSGNDQLSGNAGDDRLIGGEGRDQLIGGSGNDQLIGGEGSDRLTGNGGRDRFIYQAVSDQVDRITDFNPALDLLDLSSLFTASRYTSLTPLESYVRLSQAGSDTLVRIDTNGDAANGLTRLTILENVLVPSTRNFIV